MKTTLSSSWPVSLPEEWQCREKQRRTLASNEGRRSRERGNGVETGGGSSSPRSTTNIGVTSGRSPDLTLQIPRLENGATEVF